MTKIIAGVAVALLCVGCGESAPANRTIHGWQVVSVKSPQTLKVGKEVNYCTGYPHPTFRRPQILYQDNDVYIELKVRWPRRPSKGDLCLGMELLITRTIVLRRDLKDVRVYDSGVEPPELRWPSE